MKNGEVKAVEMVRRIRDHHHEELKDKTAEEQIAYYREKARGVLEEAEARKRREKRRRAREPTPTTTLAGRKASSAERRITSHLR